VPVKYEQVVFCNLSDLQLSLYRLFISSPEIQKLLRGKGSQPLKAIGLLKKLCNHPGLLDLPNDLQGCEDLLPPGYSGSVAATKNLGGREQARTVDCTYSGKFVVLERYVLSSHRTWARLRVRQNAASYQDADDGQNRAHQQLYPNLGLDGTTLQSKRVCIFVA
jgi:DNA repair and recombination RAD54-like protein